MDALIPLGRYGKEANSSNTTALQLQFLGHVLRKHNLEDVALTGEVEGKRGRGMQMLNYVVSLGQRIETSERDILRAARNRELLKSMATKILNERCT